MTPAGARGSPIASPPVSADDVRASRLLLVGGAWLGALGAVVLAGRASGAGWLVTFVPGGAPMAATTAACFVLTGAGFALLGRSRLAWLAGGTAGAVGAAMLTLYGLGEALDWNWFRAVAPPVVNDAVRAYPDRMAPNAALSFTVLGFAQVAMARGVWRPRLLATAAALLLALGGLSLVGYASGLRTAFSWWRYTGMAAHTAVGFVLAGATVLAWVVRRTGAAERTIVRTFPFFALAATLLVVLGIVIVVSNDERARAGQQVRQSFAVHAEIERFIGAMARMDAATRNFSLTGEERYVERIAVHRQAIGAALDALEQLASSAEQAAQVRLLRQAAGENFRLKDEQVAAWRHGGMAAALAAFRAEPPEVISALRTATTALQQNEERLRVEREASSERNERRLRWVLALGGAAALGLLGTAFGLVSGAQRRLREAHDRLEERVLERTRTLSQVTEELRAAEARFRGALVDSPVPAMLWSDTGEILLLNTAWLERCGYSAAELPTIADWTRRAFGREPPADLPQLMARRFAGATRIHDGECDVRTKSGELQRWDFHTACIGRLPDGGRLLVSKAVDVTERHAAAARLQESEQRYRQLAAGLEVRVAERTAELRAAQETLAATNRLQRAVLDGNAFAIIATRPDGTIEIFSRGAEQMLGYAAADLVGRATPEVLHVPEEMRARAIELGVRLGTEIAAGFEVFAALARRGEADEREWTFVRKDGSRLPVRLGVTALHDAAGGIAGFLHLAQDLTARRMTEVALQASEKRLLEVLGKADCLVWEAQVQLRSSDWDWHFIVQPSGLYTRIFGGQPSNQEAGLWYRFEIPEQEEMNARCREALRDGRAGYEQEFRVVRRGETTWIRESVSISRAGGADEFWLVGVATDITARRAAEFLLRESEERFRQAFAYAGIGMAIVGLDARWLRVNAALCEILGYDDAALMRRTLQEIAHPDDRAEAQAALAQLHAGTQRACRLDQRYLHRAGHLVWVRLTASLVRDAGGEPLHFVAQIEDRTEQRRAGGALRESEERMRLFAEHAPASVAMFDREMRYLVVSREWMAAYHLKGDIIGRSHYDVFPEIGEDWKAIHRRCLAGAVESREADLFVRASGERQWLRWEVRPWFDAAGEIGGIVMFTADITERKLLEENLAEARDAALAASRMKSDFLATMSHEIRTPMNAVAGLSALLGETPLSEVQLQMTRTIQSGAESLLAIINDILDFSRIEAGKLRLEPGEFELRRSIEETVALLAPRAREKQLELTCRIDPAVDGRLLGDAGRVRQVVTNLLGNAIKFTDRGSVRVEAAALRATTERIAVRVSVRDTGVGIAPGLQAQIFQPFVQGDASTTRRFGGTGLGLAISRQLLDLMGGTIGCESEPGRGSVFWFDLELPRAARDSAAPIGGAPEAAPARQAALHLLLVEDNPANQTVASLLLARLGHRVDIAANGQIALERLARQRFDAVLMDCQMPVLDGYETTRRIRSGELSGVDSRVPIVALTAYAMEGDRARCLAAGMDDHLAKPIRLAELRAALERLGAPGPASESPIPTPAAGAIFDEAVVQIARELPGGLLREMTKLFLADEPAALERIARAVAERQGSHAAELAHGFAGTVAAFGASEARAIALELENAARAEDWTQADARCAGLQAACRRLREAIAARGFAAS